MVSGEPILDSVNEKRFCWPVPTATMQHKVMKKMILENNIELLK